MRILFQFNTFGASKRPTTISDTNGTPMGLRVLFAAVVNVFLSGTSRPLQKSSPRWVVRPGSFILSLFNRLSIVRFCGSYLKAAAGLRMATVRHIGTCLGNFWVASLVLSTKAGLVSTLLKSLSIKRKAMLGLPLFWGCELRLLGLSGASFGCHFEWLRITTS